MSLVDDMAAAHERDSRAERRMRNLITEIDRVLAEPHRLSDRTKAALGNARAELVKDADHIVAVWN